MNSMERVIARLDGKTCDRIPNFNILMQFNARELNVPYSKYCTDYKALVAGSILSAEKYGLDCVTTMSDPMREASAFGTEVVFPEDGVPYSKQNLILEQRDIKKLKPVKPSVSGRMSETIYAIELFRRELGREMPVIGWVEGCMAEAADYAGSMNFWLT